MPSGLRFFRLIFIMNYYFLSEFLALFFIFHPTLSNAPPLFRSTHALSLLLILLFSLESLYFILLYIYLCLSFHNTRDTTTGGPTTLPFPITLSHSITVTDDPHTPGPRFMLSWVHLSIFSITAFSPRTHLAFPPPLSLFLAEIWLFMAKQPPLHLLSMAASAPLHVRTTLCTIDHFSICCHPNTT